MPFLWDRQGGTKVSFKGGSNGWTDVQDEMTSRKWVHAHGSLSPHVSHSL